LQTCLDQLLRLTGDEEGLIRTNACICAAKIACLPQTVPLFKKHPDRLLQLLQQIFLSSLKDSFSPCRQAALQARTFIFLSQKSSFPEEKPTKQRQGEHACF
ncbi:putative SCY kinase (incomplete catalytic triad), partial [Toxoplasma gondii p89]